MDSLSRLQELERENAWLRQQVEQQERELEELRKLKDNSLLTDMSAAETPSAPRTSLTPIAIPPLSLQPEFQPKSDDRYHINDLLRYHNDPFVQNAYRAILKRIPDAEERHYYIEGLRSGRCNKIDILARLRFSAEGKAKGVRIRGLGLSTGIRRAGRLPLLGYLVRLISALVRLPIAMRNQQQFEVYSSMLHQQLADHINRISAQLINHSHEVSSAPIRMSKERGSMADDRAESERTEISLENLMQQIREKVRQCREEKVKVESGSSAGNNLSMAEPQAVVSPPLQAGVQEVARTHDTFASGSLFPSHTGLKAWVKSWLMKIRGFLGKMWRKSCSVGGRCGSNVVETGALRELTNKGEEQLPLVSIIVLNLNGEAIIGRCLDHLLAQTYPRLEIVVVDQGSTDRSLEILNQYIGRGGLSVIRSERNLGIAGGRNLGLRWARGEIIAFMDNDGYAARDWLKEAVRTLLSEDNIGAVSSLVFFAKKKIILNGAGGTMNLLGYGGDLCYNTPYEFAAPSYEVLYPMGCGMVVRRSVLERVGPLDPWQTRWFDDTELGIRVWKSGFRVVVSERALVDHDLNTSDQFIAEGMERRTYLFERARIRNALKYYPLSKLSFWLFAELKWTLQFLRLSGLRRGPLRSWAWNILRLPSALRWRLKFSFRKNGFWHLVDRSWGSFPPPAPNNQAFRPVLQEIGRRLTLDGCLEHRQLNFGWFCAERDDSTSFRWTEGYASAFFCFASQMHSVTIRFRTELIGRLIKMIVRRLGEVVPQVEVPLIASSSGWQEERFPVCVDPGLYELLLVSGETFRDPSERRLGLAVSFIEFS